MSTYNAPGNSAPKDPGTAYKIVVRICGLVVIAGVFLPFMFGRNIIEFFTTFANKVEIFGLGGAVEFMFGASTAMGAVTKTLINLGFIVFPILGISMALRAKYAGGPLTFLILFNIAGWCLIHFFGYEAGWGGNFFGLVEIGYWVSCGGLFAPFLAMFFLDKSI